MMLLVTLLAYQALGDSNVFDKPMTHCGSMHASGCTYAAQDAGAHEVCVTALPQGFSSDTGQGPWSDSYTGQPWCICIWAYSNYILQHKDLQLKCESIPSKVLEEQYSLDKFEQCGEMSSTTGCGAEDIRRSIQSLCEQCDAQAADGGSKAALKTKCDAILASAPAATMLFESENTASAIKSSIGSQSTRHAIAFGGFMLMSAGAAVMLAVRASRRMQIERDTNIEEPAAAQRDEPIE